MRKSNIVSGCLLAFLVGVLLWQACGNSNPAKEQLYENFGDWLDQRVFADRQTESRRLAVNRFVHFALDVEDALVHDRLTLEEAVTKIHAAALEHYPQHLDWMARFEKGDTPQERIAHNIARHIEEDDELSQNQELRARLQLQLAELLKKYQKPAPLPMVGALAA